MDKNNVWELVDLPPGRKTTGNKWVLKVKRKADGSIDRYVSLKVLIPINWLINPRIFM